MTRLPLLALALSACGATGPLARAPDARLADEIEAKLSKIGCIGPMSRWERHYSYSARPSTLATMLTLGRSNLWFNYNSIEIDYRQAGFEEFRSRRVLYSGLEPVAIDDRNYDLVLGHYDVPARTAYIWACGPNSGGEDNDPDHPRIVVR
jgi:hypothetical protein